MKLLFLSFLLFLSVQISAQNVKFTISNLPQNHNYKDNIYLAGDFNNWNPADDNYKMKFVDGQYTLTVKMKKNVSFKFTRGSWATVEKGKECEEIKNRDFVFKNDTTLKLQIFNWKDKCTSSSTAQNNVFIVDSNFFIPQLNTYRTIRIYLPPDYRTSDKRYSVLYMHDGQNLFDDFTSYTGEWGIDESLNKMFDNGDYGCIVVGIDNGQNTRLDEYSAWKNPNYGGGKGDEYLQFIVETLKPFIDANYKTLPDRENTGIMGSSMGGLISLYAGLKYQDVFSKIGVFSPSLWFSTEMFKYAKSTKIKHEVKFYFLVGGYEKGMDKLVKKMIKTLEKSGFGGKNIYYKFVANGKHSEWFWKQEFPQAYEFLFGAK